MKKRIRDFLLQGEGETLDYKQTISSASKIAKTMVAFANHNGGTLLVGVKDNKKICGVRDADDKYMLDLAANFYCKPPVSLELITHDIGGLQVIECNVLKGEHKPYYAKDEDGKWWVYVRVKDNTLLASKIVVDVLRKSNSDEGVMVTYGSKEKAILEYLSTHDRITLAEYKHLVNISTRRATRIIVDLITAGVLRSHTTEKVEYYTLV